MFDLPAYFARIGYTGPADVSRATLDAIVLRHTLSIPFENIDAFLGRSVSLDPQAVAYKLIRQRRGGWCFEQNLLLGEALRALGFKVTDLAGRVLLGRSVDDITPRSHRLLRIELDGRSWIADVGFGATLTPTGVLDLAIEDTQPTPHGPYRLARVGEDRRLEVLYRGDWVPMFRFDLQPQFPVDYEAVNFKLVHDPASSFVQRLGVSVMAPEGRHGLRGHELSFLDMQGNITRRELDTPEVINALADVFGIETDAGTREAVAARLERTRAADAAR